MSLAKMILTPLFIFEMANNHMGRVDHGLRIIREIREACRGFAYRFAFKFQYRHLDSFIHPDFQGRNDIKYVKRFSETRLDADEFQTMKTELDRQGFLSICTPFDEPSVDLIEAQGFDIIKVASCSFTDWPLLERIARTNKPVIASTAGVSVEDIDKVVSFLGHRAKEFALMHCVAEYPTPQQNLQLNQLGFLKTRYPGVPIGFSSHESPECTNSVKMALAAGATIFEKHVGVPTDEIKLNDYSATPAQISAWLAAAQEGDLMCGTRDKRMTFTENESASLRALRRGVFAKRDICAGERINLGNVFLAIPVTEDQLTANDLSKYTEFYACKNIHTKAAVSTDAVRRIDQRERVYEIVRRVRSLLANSGVAAPGQAELEISHHYGLDQFEKFGITMITVVNRQYCKKLIIMLPGQSHPEQYHKEKEETFHVLWGDVQVQLTGVATDNHKGDVIVVEPGVKHMFSTHDGAVIEEISSTHYVDDSYYTDPAIMANKNRKTLLTYWMG